MTKRFQRPVNEYSGAGDLLYKDKYQQDSNSVPKIAISSSKVDGDFNYLVDAVNTLDEDIKSVVYAGISNEAILPEHISANAITTQKIANDAVSSKQLAMGSVTNAKIADLSVTTPKIANNSVTKDKMADSSVGTQEIEDGAITRDKLASDALSDSVPVGAIAKFSVDNLPTGWILCNGATISKNTYPQLVKFLTNSDTILSATLPELNSTELEVKSAIKAFSDTVELANIEFAGLTQDVANNAAALNTKASKYADAMAAAEIDLYGNILYSKGIKYVTRVSGGVYDVYLNDDLLTKNYLPLAMTMNWHLPFYTRYPAEGKIRVQTVSVNAHTHYNIQFTLMLFEKEEI